MSCLLVALHHYPTSDGCRKPHRQATNTNPQMKAAIAATGVDIVFDNQPAQSPGTNILDLGFFHSIQSLLQKRRTNNLPELATVVDDRKYDDQKYKCIVTGILLIISSSARQNSFLDGTARRFPPS